MPIHIITESVSQTAQLNIGDILEPQHFAVGIGSDHDILELLLGLQAPLIAHHILERLVAQLAELAGRSLDILFGQRLPTRRTASVCTRPSSSGLSQIRIE